MLTNAAAVASGASTEDGVAVLRHMIELAIQRLSNPGTLDERFRTEKALQEYPDDPMGRAWAGFWVFAHLGANPRGVVGRILEDACTRR